MAVAPMSSAVTTYRPCSSGISPTPSMLGSQDFRLQSEMKAIIENEITGATYYVDLTAEDSILFAEPGTVQAVNRDLKTTFKRLTNRPQPILGSLNTALATNLHHTSLLCNYLIKSPTPPVNTYHHPLWPLSVNFVSIGSGGK